ncbi:hypothetical protein B0H67DRAFT_603155 [Lasiosphaeris hirsuta]|uniref:Uncharacterized protein n=1 Tax=Lasiosphaeris hirsuta TaxID=260670 RepID=A0AA40DQ92_9PEZI|nr:hypothetical protein B0H67DRAFT_603155 [Lasiosphaeris hirsuta]
MSTKIEGVHPDVKLIAPPTTYDDEGLPTGFAVKEPEPVVVFPAGAQPFRFMGLPPMVQAEIFKMWLWKAEQLIHCFSRLDPLVEPDDFPGAAELGDRRTGFRNRFYWGPRGCSITYDGHKPGDLLKVLLVCKHFLFIGSHCFYGLNTFAFSSLGEFYRFCNGIGAARTDRLQNLEITLLGNQHITLKPEPRRNGAPRANKQAASLRTHALCRLTECHRLRTLVVHVNESGSSYVRRRYEGKELIKWMAGKTAGQPNHRKLRALRTVQGMDFIYQLRGMIWVRFYDLTREMEADNGSRFTIKDWSFTEDVMNTSTMRKVESRRERCQLENLAELEGLENYQPSDNSWKVVKTFFVDDEEAARDAKA